MIKLRGDEPNCDLCVAGTQKKRMHKNYLMLAYIFLLARRLGGYIVFKKNKSVPLPTYDLLSRTRRLHCFPLFVWARLVTNTASYFPVYSFAPCFASLFLSQLVQKVSKK